MLTRKNPTKNPEDKPINISLLPSGALAVRRTNEKVIKTSSPSIMMLYWISNVKLAKMNKLHANFQKLSDHLFNSDMSHSCRPCLSVGGVLAGQIRVFTGQKNGQGNKSLQDRGIVRKN